MSIEQNKMVAKRFVNELWNTQNLDIVDEIIDPDVVLHDTLWNDVRGREALKKWWKEIIFSAFSDIHMTVEDLFGEDDKVSHRWVSTSKHTGALMMVPPTGKDLRWTGQNIYWFKDGKIVELWMNQDHPGIIGQLGLMPPMNFGG